MGSRMTLVQSKREAIHASVARNRAESVAVFGSVARELTAASRPQLTLGQLLGRLTRAGVPAFADEVRRHEFA